MGREPQYPRGKIHRLDEGELAFRMGIKDGTTLIIDFGKPVAWIGLDIETLRGFHAKLGEYIAEMQAGKP